MQDLPGLAQQAHGLTAAVAELPLRIHHAEGCAATPQLVHIGCPDRSIQVEGYQLRQKVLVSNGHIMILVLARHSSLFRFFLIKNWPRNCNLAILIRCKVMYHHSVSWG
jgi:hypothetical protein